MTFTQDEVLRIIEAKNPDELALIALQFIKKRGARVALVCGPVTTGNKLSVRENRLRIARVVSQLRKKGVVVFDTSVFLRRIENMKSWETRHDREYLRQVFHLPLLRSGLVKKVYLVFEWRHSEGASWYHDHAKELNIETAVLQFSPRRMMGEGSAVA